MPLLDAVRRRLARMARFARRRGLREVPPFRLGYVIPVSEEVHNAMRRLQLRLSKECGSHLQIETHPHITVKQAFPILEIEPFEWYFDALVSDVEPFEIHICDIGIFEQGVVFLDVVQSAPLSALRRRVLHDLSERFGVHPGPLEDERYRFHATLAHGLPQRELDRARRSLVGEPLDFRCELSALALSLGVGQEWIIYKQSTLARSR